MTLLSAKAGGARASTNQIRFARFRKVQAESCGACLCPFLAHNREEGVLFKCHPEEERGARHLEGCMLRDGLWLPQHDTRNYSSSLFSNCSLNLVCIRSCIYGVKSDWRMPAASRCRSSNSGVFPCDARKSCNTKLVNCRIVPSML